MSSPNRNFPHITGIRLNPDLVRAIFGPDYPLSRTRRAVIPFDSLEWTTVFMSELIIGATWIEWLKLTGTTATKILVLEPMLNRLTLADGPHSRYGYLKTINDIITRLQRAVGDPMTATLEALSWLGTLGLQFQDSRSLERFIVKISATLDGFVDAEYPPMKQEDMVSGMSYAGVAYHLDLITYAITFDHTTRVSTYKIGSGHPNPGLLPLATELFLNSSLRPESLVYRMVKGQFDCGLCELWELLNTLTYRRMSAGAIRRLFSRKDFESGLLLALGVASGKLSNASVTLFLMYPGFYTLEHHKPADLETLAREWILCGKPCSPNEFWKLGGTAVAWQAHVAQMKSVSRTTTEVVSVGVVKKPVDQTPTGKKRRHKNFQPGSESSQIDFGALCSELDVCAYFPDLDEELVRTVLVYGLLQEGDRLATPTTLPSRNDKKLWAQVKDHVSQSSRKPFIRELRPLIDAHLVSYTGGNYQLARKNQRFPQANTLLAQLWGLVAKHTP